MKVIACTLRTSPARSDPHGGNLRAAISWRLSCLYSSWVLYPFLVLALDVEGEVDGVEESVLAMSLDRLFVGTRLRYVPCVAVPEHSRPGELSLFYLTVRSVGLLKFGRWERATCSASGTVAAVRGV